MSDLTKAAKRIEEEIKSVLYGSYEEGDEREIGIASLAWMPMDVISREPFEDDPDLPYADAYRRAAVTGRRLKDLVELVHGVAGDLTADLREAENERAKHSQAAVTWKQVNELMKGSMSSLGPPLGSQENLKLSWEVIKILREKRDALGVAKWLYAYHWEPWDTRKPTREGYSDYYVRHTLLNGRRGHVTKPEHFEDDKRHGGPLNINGIPGPDKVLVTYSGRRRKLKAKDLYPGCCVWWEEGRPCWYVTKVVVKGGRAHVDVRSGSSSESFYRPAGKQMPCRDQDFAAWVPTRFLERGRQRFRLIEDDRGEELLSMAREA